MVRLTMSLLAALALSYMDYSYDSCMDYFSMGQGARMQALSSKYRFDQ